jgi:hypothetical protein
MGLEIEPAGMVVHEIPAIVPYPVTSLIGSVGPSNFPPLWGAWQASDLKQAQTQSKLSPFHYSHLTPIS